MKSKNIYYLVRLDDACPTMNKEKWERIEIILDNYSIKPMVGIIPSNKDKQMEIEAPDIYFWDKARKWQMKGWNIALHGYDHVYLTKEGGINPIQKRSEFAGLPLKTQEEKIENGISILNKHNLSVNYFYAPSHTFDENTLKAIINKSSIRRISDTFARFPYKKGDIIFYPQQLGSFRNIKISGYWTFCFHPNTMDEKHFSTFETFIAQNSNKFESFESIKLKNIKNKSILDKFISLCYFTYRFAKKL